MENRAKSSHTHAVDEGKTTSLLHTCTLRSSHSPPLFVFRVYRVFPRGTMPIIKESSWTVILYHYLLDHKVMGGKIFLNMFK